MLNSCKWLTKEKLNYLPLSLEELDLSWTSSDSLSLKPLQSYQNLKKIILDMCMWLTEEELKYLSPFKIYT
jgi:hypothetical protein